MPESNCFGVDFEVVSQSVVDAVLEFVATGKPDDSVKGMLARCTILGETSAVWLLAHCDDGVTWGCWEHGQLVLSCTQVQAWPTPMPTAKKIQQLRLFGGAGELLVWRTHERGAFGGRLATDVPMGDSADVYKPLNETFILEGTRVAPNGGGSGFTAIASAAARTQVVPLALSEPDFSGGQYAAGLDVRHYLEDTESGSVRIAASRLVCVRRLRANDLRLS